MKKILTEIQKGKFVKEFMQENATGKKNFDALRAKGKAHPIEETGEKLRAMMPWIAKNKLVNKAAN
jgi:ketol-acid reductoisomerase